VYEPPRTAARSTGTATHSLGMGATAIASTAAPTCRSSTAVTPTT
jgi:hypothetical protein